jgi:RNA polymerase sigma-70 factor (ECF subfamily)
MREHAHIFRGLGEFRKIGPGPNILYGEGPASGGPRDGRAGAVLRMPDDGTGGQRDAWARLLSEQLRHNGRLFYRLAHGVLRDAAAAEDACQHAFLRAWEHRDRIDASPGALKAWLARTVINQSLSVARRGKVERRAIAGHAEVRAGAAVVAVGDPAETREVVLAAVARLPDACRAVVAMRLLDGMSGVEVKDLLGCSSPEVSRQLHRGMELLRGMESLRGLTADGGARMTG